MRRRALPALLATVLAGAMLLVGSGAAHAAAPTAANDAPTAVAQVSSIPITGTADDGSTFTGSFDITRFTRQGRQLAAVGTLTGTVEDASGNPVGDVNQTVTMPLQVQATCQILHLELGPLDLDLLGLVIHLDRVVLDITAEEGPGNLLGNLLCAIANLLNRSPGEGVLNAIVALLNRILSVLG